MKTLWLRRSEPLASTSDAAGVADVVPVLLEELDHRELGVEQPRLAAVVEGGVPGPVVRDREGALVALRAAGRADGVRVARERRRRLGPRALVEAVAAPGVVGLPGLVGGLVDDVRVAGVVADDEGDLALAAGVVAHQLGHVDARDRGGGHGPRSRDGPVAAVDQPRRGGAEAAGLCLGLRGRRLDVGGDQARPVTPVVAEPEDVDVPRRGGRLDLEVLGLTQVDAHGGAEPLDAWCRRRRSPASWPWDRPACCSHS